MCEYINIMCLIYNSGKNKKKVKNVSKKKPAFTQENVKKITQYQGYATMCAGFFKVIIIS